MVFLFFFQGIPNPTGYSAVRATIRLFTLSRQKSSVSSMKRNGPWADVVVSPDASPKLPSICSHAVLKVFRQFTERPLPRLLELMKGPKLTRTPGLGACGVEWSIRPRRRDADVITRFLCQ